MRSLFRLFRGIILKVTAIYLVGSIIGVLALDKLFGGYEFYIGMLVFIAPILAWVETFMLVPKNLDWVMSLPISKRNILVLHYVTSIFASFATMVATIVSLLVLTVIKTDSHIQLSRLVKTTPALVSEAKVAQQSSNIDIYGWMTALLMLSFFHALSMSISRPVTTKRLWSNLWNHVSPAVRWAIRTGWIGAVLFAAVFRDYVLSPFGIFFIATIVFLFLTTLNTTHALGLGRTQRRRWIAISGIFAGVQIVFLFVHATVGVRSASFDRRVASVMFLGPFSGGISRPDLIRLLEADIKPDRIEDLGEHFRKTFTNGGKIRLSVDRDVNFVKVISTKKTYGALIATLGMFEPADFGYEELKAFFDRLQPLLADCHCEHNGYDLLSAKLHWSETLKLLGSNNDSAVAFGLLWARYHAQAGDAEFIPAIRRDMGRYPDKLKLSALRTLSVLNGRKYTFDDWMKDRGGRAVSSVRFDVSCDAWSAKSVTELGSEDVPALNYCIRQRAELAQVPEIEAAGWLEPPFDGRARTVIRKVLHVK